MMKEVTSNEEIAGAWGNLARYFVGHVSETLGDSSRGHPKFERLVRVQPPDLAFWSAIASLLREILESQTVEKQDVDGTLRESWDAILAFGREVEVAPLRHGDSWIRATVNSHICHPDGDSPAGYLNCALSTMGRRPLPGGSWAENECEQRIRSSISVFLPSSGP